MAMIRAELHIHVQPRKELSAGEKIVVAQKKESYQRCHDTRRNGIQHNDNQRDGLICDSPQYNLIQNRVLLC